MTRKVTVIHPWLPQYRLQFFERAIEVLGKDDIELTVAHGAPPPDVRSRADDVEAPWARPLPTRSWQLGSRALLLHRLEGMSRGRELVIAEHAIRNLETYVLAAHAAHGGPRLALWGHGRTYTKASSGIESSLKDRLARAAHWFFAYTAEGAEYVAGLGVRRERITVVQNSVDTEDLQRAVRRVSPARVSELRSSLRLTEGRTALSIGALDASKRLDLLLAAGQEAADRLPGFTLVIAGAGPQEQVVRDRTDLPWLRYVGPVFGEAKAELAAVSDLMLMAGRVGLAAVDSFALELPMVTCSWAWHAPEFDYLVDGVNSAIVADSQRALGARVASLLEDRLELARLQAGCRVAAATYTLEAMVERFCTGVQDALEAPARADRGPVLADDGTGQTVRNSA